MGLWVLETYRHAPGTVQLIDDHAQSSTGDNVLLVPHPSKSPNDPLVSACHLLRILYLLTKRAFLELASMEKGPGIIYPGFCIFSGGYSRYFYECNLGPKKVQY